MTDHALVDRIAEVLREHLGCEDCTGAPSDQYTAQVAWETAEVVRLRIETIEQLNALPVGALIGYHDSTRTFRRLWTADDGDSEHFWQEPGGYAYRSADIPLPATLLWTPGDTDDR